MVKYTTVSIPVDLAEKIKKQIEDTGFKNLSDYTTFVLREIAANKAKWDESKDKTDEQAVIEKLKALGYIK